jgi:hypothetical protein
MGKTVRDFSTSRLRFATARRALEMTRRDERASPCTGRGISLSFRAEFRGCETQSRNLLLLFVCEDGVAVPRLRRISLRP